MRGHADVPMLIVEDHQIVLAAIVDMLRAAGYRPTGASDSAEALRLLEGEKFALVVADILMPGQDGLAVARRARDLHPDVGLILMSGYPDLDFPDAAALSGAYFLEKPFSSEMLLGAVRDALHAPAG